jgi:hypothetical protein
MRPLVRSSCRTVAALVLSLVAAAGTGAQTSPVPGSVFLPAPAWLAGWTASGPPEHFEREGLYGYINGGSEVFLQYGFRRVDVGRYRKGSGEALPEVTADIYLMGSDLEAFGIFSIRREGGDRTIDLGGIPNWVSGAQGSLAAGPYYINLVGFQTNDEDIAHFVGVLGENLRKAGHQGFAPASLPGPWTKLPSIAIRPDSVRVIRGPLAARDESELLASDLWDFAGETSAASARYGPDGRKLIVVESKGPTAGLLDGMRGLFAEYLKAVKVEDGVLSGMNELGHMFLFATKGRMAALVLGRADATAARVLLDAALARVEKPLT